MDNTLFQSITDKADLSQDAKTIASTLDVMTSMIVGRLIEARLIAYDGQPGEAIEYTARIIASAIVDGLKSGDMVEIVCLHNLHSTVKW